MSLSTKIMFQGLRILFNIIIFFAAQNRFPEFNGLKGQRFPGTPPPRIQEILPRRPSSCLSEMDKMLLLHQLKNKNKQTLSINVQPAQPVMEERKFIDISYI